MSLCSVSIDLDAIECYYRIHALGPAPRALRHVIIERCVPRAVALFAKHGINVTWFVVGQDVDVANDASAVASATVMEQRAAAGDELANHSHRHRYELARLDAKTIRDEIVTADRVLARLAGQPIAGFRSPGYDVSAVLFDVLAELGYQYDSSLFPAPGYYAAKAAVMAALAALRRPSGAVMTNPRGLLAPIDPYRPAMTAPWRRGDAPFVELPISVTPWARLPAIGTSLLVAPAPLRRYILQTMAQREFFNFELHGIDFCDASDDEIAPELVARQPDLRLPWSQKADRLDAMLTQIASTSRRVTLQSAALTLQQRW
ncbi:MAG TPA: polysaccharide deacetylase family protein [Kofleriaceae bacterium]|nr:polysaccharide deacetylase family protein [Kofleriaceae bacterium]